MMNTIISFTLIVNNALLLLLVSFGDSALQDICSSKIFCRGEILNAVQMAGLFNDSKTFIDMALVSSHARTEKKFKRKKAHGILNITTVKEFVENNFKFTQELTKGQVIEWYWKPPMVNRMVDIRIKAWIVELNFLWETFSKKVTRAVNERNDRFSLINVPNSFIVPGGRLREIHYWDTYWIIRGLLLCNLHKTAQEVISNLLYLVRKYSYVPAGSRKYYTRNSQPPFLIPMVYEYFMMTKNFHFLRENIDLLEKEFNFWMKYRKVEVKKGGKTYELFRYNTDSPSPRPEFYREDVDNAKIFPRDKQKKEFYSSLKSASESGWELSSRWIIKKGTNIGNITNIRTKHIVPVDLNAFLYRNAKLLATMFINIERREKAGYYSDIANKLEIAITSIMWNNRKGSWFDYDLLNKKQRVYFYASNLVPLWAKCYKEDNSKVVANKVTKYLHDTVMKRSLIGVPASVYNTGLRWDFPNSWPPLQHMIIQGLEDTNETSAQDLAFKMANMWLESVHKGYTETFDLYEMYDTTTPGKYGEGGDYTVQAGYAWTIGVILDLLNLYGHKISTDNWRPH